MAVNRRVLIISNECLSKSTSNGRTLLNFFAGYSNQHLAQFSIHGIPDRSICVNNYQISDSDALNAFLHRKNKEKKDKLSAKIIQKKSQRCRNMLIRDFVWSTNTWWDKGFDDFISAFSPELVLLQAGDSPFMYAIARKICKRLHIPLMMYNSESYVLKKRIYSSANPYSPWHIILMNRLRHQYRLLMNNCDFCVYSMEKLEEAYQAAYPHPLKSKTIYISSSIHVKRNVHEENRFVLAYCGNLGVGRAACLAELAEILNTMGQQAKLIICGKFSSQEEQEKVTSFPVVDYRGVVSYSEVIKIMRNASMVVHCENKDRLENLKYAFSTKIADSIACGIPFLVYASHEYPFVQYLEKNNAAHVASDTQELYEILKQCMENKAYRDEPVQNALTLAKKNHNHEQNAHSFQEIIEMCIEHR